MRASNSPIAEAMRMLEISSVYTVQVPVHGWFEFKWASAADSEVLDNKIGSSGPCKVVFIYD